MAALATATTTTTVTELVPAELIDAFVGGFEYPQAVGELVAERKPGLGNVPVRFPRWNEIDLSGIGSSHTETDTAVDVFAETVESSITPAMRICRMPFADEAGVMAAAGAVPGAALAELLLALRDLMDVNILAASTSATLSTGANTTTLTLQGLRSAVAYFRAQNIPSQAPNLVLASAAAGDLEESMGSSAASYALSESDIKRFGPDCGLKGMLLGCRVFVSTNVAADGGGYSNFMVPGEPGRSSLGLVVQEMPNLRPTRGDDAESRAVSYVVGRAWWGASIINPRQFVEILSA